jgi:prepilin-type N-terminal cleavage/methylation domain-containing protein
MRRPRQHRRARAAGFTLVEVMLALAILSISLTMLISSSAGQVWITQDSQSLSAASDLARGKMFDLEELLLQEGFQDTDQTLEGDFDEEGWPGMEWKAVIETIELPNLGATQEMAGEGGEGGEAADPMAGNPIMGMMGMFGGGGGEEGEGNMATAGLIQSQFELVSKVLEAAIRRVTLTVTWQSAYRDQDLEVIAYFTDPAAMSKVIQTGGVEEEPTGDEPPPEPPR